MDLCHVSEVRPGGVPKVGKFLVLVLHHKVTRG